MSRFLIMSCSATKTANPHGLAPAYMYYDGPAWRVYRAWRRAHRAAAARLPVFAISAKHGLVDALNPIEAYDERMDRARAETYIAAGTDTELDAELTRAGDPAVLVFGSALYASVAEAWLPDNYEYRCTCDGARGIGDMLGELKRWLSAPSGEGAL